MTKRISIAAIDPSLTSTGLVCGTSADDLQVTRHRSKTSERQPSQRFRRYEDLIAGIASILDDVDPDLILIEGYSYGSTGFTQVLITEFGGVLRSRLLDFTRLVVEVPPTTLKKFVTGRGNCPKDLMLKEVFKRWGFDTSNNDEADAYGLFRMGLVIAGAESSQTVSQKEAIETVMKSHKLTNDQINDQTQEAPF